MGLRPVGSAPPTLSSAPPPKYQHETVFDWLQRQNEGRASTKVKTLDRLEPIKGNNPKTQTTK